MVELRISTMNLHKVNLDEDQIINIIKSAFEKYKTDNKINDCYFEIYERSGDVIKVI